MIRISIKIEYEKSILQILVFENRSSRFLKIDFRSIYENRFSTFRFLKINFRSIFPISIVEFDFWSTLEFDSWSIPRTILDRFLEFNFQLILHVSILQNWFSIDIPNLGNLINFWSITRYRSSMDSPRLDFSIVDFPHFDSWKLIIDSWESILHTLIFENRFWIVFSNLDSQKSIFDRYFKSQSLTIDFRTILQIFISCKSVFNVT